jgi:hypothetical protein
MSTLPSFLAIYAERECKTRIRNLNLNDEVIAGTRKEITLFVRNEGPNDIKDLVFVATDPDISFVPNAIHFIAAGDKAPIQLIVVWNPPSTRETPLATDILADFFVIKRA